MRRVRGSGVALLAFVATLLASITWSATDDEPADALAIRVIEIDTPGPLGPITVFGDSVMLGGGLYSPTFPQRLAEQGWGPIKYLAGAGFNSGQPVRGPAPGRITTWIQQWRSEGWTEGPWIVHVGANDARFCRDWDIACARGIIDSVLTALGPDTDVWWPMITHEVQYRAAQDTWNIALGQLADERPQLDTWDWPREMAAGSYPSPDNIHLSPTGYRLRSERMADVATARLAQGRPSGFGPVALPAAGASPSRLVPGPAVRVVDTRVDSSGRQSRGDVLRVDLTDHVPPGTTAAAFYVTAVDPRTKGHLVVAPCDSASTASSVNFAAGVTRGAPTITRIGDDRSVCVTTRGDAHLTVDLQAAFHPSDPAGLGFAPLAVPVRLADTRQTARTDRLVVTAPPSAEAVAINLTSVGSWRRGHVKAAPCDVTPRFANLNFRPGAPIAASAIVDVGDDGTFCVTTRNETHLVVDLTGVFSSTAELGFVPVLPTRMLDTRTGVGGWRTIHGPGQTVRARVAPPEAAAVTGTITAVNPWLRTFLTGYGCQGAPATSSVNTGEFTVTANSATISTDAGHICIDTATATHSLFDTTGWWVPTSTPD